MIHFDRFGWRFGGSMTWAIQDVSIRINRGEFVTIAGPSGSGKTTLALAMCGLLVGRCEGETQGHLHLDGEHLADLPLHRVADRIALVQQNPDTHFATAMVADEVAFGLENHCVPRGEIHRRVGDALKLLKITHLAQRDLSTLSGGEKQRVAVASIVAGMPAAIVLDEPTASLDPQASEELFHALADLCRQSGLTVLIIEHKLARLLPLKPRLVTMQAGRISSDRAAGADHGMTVARRSPSSGLAPKARAAAESSTTPDAVIVNVENIAVELEGKSILTDVSLRVRAGEVVAIMGPNGGGKTTLLHSLIGLTKPVRGTIEVCGADVIRTSISRLARDVGLVFQNADHQLVADTVWHESVYAARQFDRLDAAAEQGADRLLRRAGLSSRKQDHPYRLSWGEKRRLNLISAVLHGPRLLLLDEPFAGQDGENVAFLLEVIGGVLNKSGGLDADELPTPDVGNRRESQTVGARGACLMVTHDPRAVLGSCTRIVFIAGGRISLDAPLPSAFDRLRGLGYGVYIPVDCSSPSV